MGKKIMIVEDDLPAAAALAHVLRREGCEVRTFRDGEAALQAIEQDAPDAIALDVKLSGAIDGHAFLRLLQDIRKPAPPVLFVTNVGLPQEVEKGKATGAVDYLVKSDHSVQDIARRLMEVA